MVNGLFNACKKIDPGTIHDGLSIVEVMQKSCVEFLTILLGLDEDQIENDFKKVDTDGNGRVTLMEGRDAFNQLRSKYETEKHIRCCVNTEFGEKEEVVIVMQTANDDGSPCAQDLFSKTHFEEGGSGNTMPYCIFDKCNAYPFV